MSANDPQVVLGLFQDPPVDQTGALPGQFDVGGAFIGVDLADLADQGERPHPDRNGDAKEPEAERAHGGHGQTGGHVHAQEDSAYHHHIGNNADDAGIQGTLVAAGHDGLLGGKKVCYQKTAGKGFSRQSRLAGGGGGRRAPLP